MSEERLTEDDLRRIIDGEYTDREARDADWLERAGREIQALRDHIAKLEEEREAVIADLRKRLKETEGREARRGYQYAIMVLENPDEVKGKEAEDDRKG